MSDQCLKLPAIRFSCNVYNVFCNSIKLTRHGTEQGKVYWNQRSSVGPCHRQHMKPFVKSLFSEECLGIDPASSSLLLWFRS